MKEEVACPKCGEVLTFEAPQTMYDAFIDHISKCPQKVPVKVVKRITDVVPEDALKGNLITMDELLGQDILITGMIWRESSFKEDTDYLSLTLELQGEEKVLNTGAERVLQAFRAVPPDSFPFYATFEKIQLPNGRRVYRVK